ncbi:MAG: NAD-dependent epimerase/dehydratase family protein [Bacilli bacterium]
MKKILVTGAAGTIGIQVIRYLLIEGKYEITALDLRNARTYKRLKKYRKRINIVYGDVNDSVIVDALVKDHDVVIHLAGVMPPFADIKEDLCYVIDYEGTKNIVNAISSYNPKCYLLYASSTTIYGNVGKKVEVSVNSPINIEDGDYYSSVKAETEKLIEDTIKNYTIFRIPSVMCNPLKECVMYNVPLNNYVELISSYDAGYAFAIAVDYFKELNKKTYNLSGGESCRVLYRDYLVKILRTHGLSFRYLLTLFLVDKNFYGAYYKDGNKLENILHFRKDSIASYYNKLDETYSGIRRFIPRLLAKPFIGVIARKKTKKKEV